MRSGPVELQPAREFVQRMHELEAELQRARQAQRRQRSDPDSASRWGLESRPVAQQEEGWFLTYLDMMTLLLVAMIVMLAFSGGMVRGEGPRLATADRAGRVAAASAAPAAPADAAAGVAAQAAPPQPETGEIPPPDLPQPYPPSSAGDFERSAYPDQAAAAMASAYPTPADLTPPPAPAAEPVAAPAAASAAVAASASVPPPATPGGASASVPPPATPGAAPASQGTPAVQQATAAAAPSSPAQPLAGAGEAPAPVQAASAQPAPAQAATPGATPAAPASPGPSAAVAAAPASGAAVATPAAPSAAASPAPEAPNPQSEGEALAAALPLDELGSEVEVIVNKRSVSLRVNNEILFGTGQADLSSHGLTVLKRLAEVLSKGGYDIVVEGHTDSVPVRNNGRYPSNWELSTARAGSVVRYLQASGIDKAHLKAVGYADTRPLASNKDAEGRARNRRVELVIEKRTD